MTCTCKQRAQLTAGYSVVQTQCSALCASIFAIRGYSKCVSYHMIVVVHVSLLLSLMIVLIICVTVRSAVSQQSLALHAAISCSFRGDAATVWADVS
jgi:hypothetical protein